MCSTYRGCVQSASPAHLVTNLMFDELFKLQEKPRNDVINFLTIIGTQRGHFLPPRRTFFHRCFLRVTIFKTPCITEQILRKLLASKSNSRTTRCFSTPHRVARKTFLLVIDRSHSKSTHLNPPPSALRIFPVFHYRENRLNGPPSRALDVREETFGQGNICALFFPCFFSRYSTLQRKQ